MILAYLLLITGLTISSVAIYYSVVGLTAIFSAAAIPIMIMGVSLEVAKLVCATWIKANWNRVPALMKTYMCVAVIVLMLITSMGIFGFLSKAHNDQNLVSGDVQNKIAIIDEKIKTARENIEASRKQLRQMDEAVDQIMGRSKDERGAANANAVRTRQAKDRAAIAREIETNQKLIVQLNEEAAPVRAEIRKVDAEVGPIKYIASFLYGTEPDVAMLEKAVTWIIILIVVVFDPLAVIMLLGAQMSFAWARSGGVVRDRDGTIVGIQPPPEEVARTEARIEPIIEEKKTDLDLANEIIQQGVTNSNPVDNVPVVEPVEELPFKGQGLAPSVPFTAPITFNKPRVKRDIKKRRERKSREEQIIAEVSELIAEETLQATEPLELDPTPQPNRIANPEAAPGPNRGVMYSAPVQADNAPKLGKASNTSFGNEFPGNPEKGDVYLRVDYLPNRLFKFNGSKWIEVDKTQTDLYAYDELYIQHLIAEIDAGRYDVESLTDLEREQIQQQLNKKA
jgi:hypothetical protein